jgi:hypothetical protein
MPRAEKSDEVELLDVEVLLVEDAVDAEAAADAFRDWVVDSSEPPDLCEEVPLEVEHLPCLAPRRVPRRRPLEADD